MKKSDGADLAVLFCTIILPPLGVFFKVGFRLNFWINLFLTIFGFYFVGLIHGLYVILKK